MPCSGLDSGVLIGIGGSYAAHVAKEMGHKFLAECLSKVAERICSESSRPTWIAKAPADGDSENRLEATLGGNFIEEEFKDTQMDVQKLVKECTVDAKEIVDKCPIFIFGRSRQGKSTLVNNLLKALGKEVHPDGHASVGHMTPCTKGVQMYSCKCSEWTTPGLEEEVILFDSEGWELGKAVDLWSECMKKAKEKKIGQEVLPQRLVLVLVVSASAESRSELADPEFQRLVREVCIQAKQAADKAKVVSQSWFQWSPNPIFWRRKSQISENKFVMPSIRCCPSPLQASLFLGSMGPTSQLLAVDSSDHPLQFEK